MVAESGKGKMRRSCVPTATHLLELHARLQKSKLTREVLDWRYKYLLR